MTLGDKCLFLPVHITGALRHKQACPAILRRAWSPTCVLTTQTSLPGNASIALPAASVMSQREAGEDKGCTLMNKHVCVWHLHTQCHLHSCLHVHLHMYTYAHTHALRHLYIFKYVDSDTCTHAYMRAFRHLCTTTWNPIGFYSKDMDG